MTQSQYALAGHATFQILSPEGMSGHNVISIVNVTEIGKFTGVKE